MGIFSRANNTTPVITTYSPLKVRLDCIIDLNLYKMLVHNDYLIFDNPGKSHQVTHVGSTTFHGLNVNRFYINPMDGADGESMLQVMDDGNGNLQSDDIMLFREVDTIYPEDEEEWEQWLGDEDTENPGIIGSEFFELENDDDEAIIYEEGSGSADLTFHVSPATSQNEEPYEMPTTSALFKRNIADEGQADFFEYLLVAVEDEERITIYAGIKVPASQITVN